MVYLGKNFNPSRQSQPQNGFPRQQSAQNNQYRPPSAQNVFQVEQASNSQNPQIPYKNAYQHPNNQQAQQQYSNHNNTQQNLQKRDFSSTPYLTASTNDYFAAATTDNQVYIFKNTTQKSSFHSQNPVTLLHQLQLTSDKGPVHIYQLGFAEKTLIVTTTVSLLLIDFNDELFTTTNILDLIKCDMQPRIFAVKASTDANLTLNLVSKDVFFDAENRQFFGENQFFEIQIGFVVMTDKRQIQEIQIISEIIVQGRISAVSANFIILENGQNPSTLIDLRTNSQIFLDFNSYDCIVELQNFTVVSSFQGFGIIVNKENQIEYFCKLGQLILDNVTAVVSASKPIYAISGCQKNDDNSIYLGASSGYVFKIVFNQLKISLIQQMIAAYGYYQGSNLLGFELVGDMIFCICGREGKENGVFWEKKKGSQGGREFCKVVNM